MIGLDLMESSWNGFCESEGRSENHGNRFWRRWKRSKERNNLIRSNGSGNSTKNASVKTKSFLGKDRTRRIEIEKIEKGGKNGKEGEGK